LELHASQNPVPGKVTAPENGHRGLTLAVLVCSAILGGCVGTRDDATASIATCPIEINAPSTAQPCLPATTAAASNPVAPVATSSEPPKSPPGPDQPVPATTGSLLPPGTGAKARLAQDPRSKPGSAGTVSKLADAVATAILTYPEIKINQARVREAGAGIGIAQSVLYPTLDVRVAQGGNFSGNYEGRNIPYKASSNALEGRFDGGLILRQLVYDFGAAEADIDRARLLRDAEKQKLQEKVEEIAHRTSQTYLRIIEQRALLSLVDEIIAAHEQLAKIVKAHNAEGHGTVADVQRVTSRLVDVRAIRADVSLQLMAAEDQMSRFTRQPTGRLVPPPDYSRNIPKSPAAAIARVLTQNPRLGALMATRQATQRELDSYQASILPKINLEVETESKNFRTGQLGRTQAEGRAMIAVRYRLMDGGLSAATQEQIGARINGAELSYVNEREQIEADIRQAYRAIDSASRKTRLVSEGVEASRQVRELYLEQFKGGKRTIFELLDGQMSYYTIRRSQIESQFEGRRAVFDILRATSDLTLALSGK
jgi:outer membrane protein, adhesin transport system